MAARSSSRLIGPSLTSPPRSASAKAREPQRLAEEIGAQRKQDHDLRAAGPLHVPPDPEQRFDEAIPPLEVLADRVDLLELVADDQRPMLGRARNDPGDDVGKRGSVMLEAHEVMLDVPLAGHRAVGPVDGRGQRLQEGAAGILVRSERGDEPVSLGAQARHQPGEDHRRFAAARRAEQGDEAALLHGLLEFGRALIPTEEERRVLLPEREQTAIRAGRDRGRLRGHRRPGPDRAFRRRRAGGASNRIR